MKAFIEQIEGGHGVLKSPFGTVLKETPDILDISNNLGLFTGYRQLGQFSIKRPHNFKEREWVDVALVDGKITEVKKLGTTKMGGEM